jgi:uncharacterized protein
MSGKKTFIGRQQELRQLNLLTEKKTASFVVVKGRRRIGKSRLIDEFGKSFDNYYKFEGLAPEANTTSEDQLEEFCIQISREFKTPRARYDDWSDALWAVGERVQSGKILLFFDEISWMGSKTPTFLGKIKIFWDDLLKKNDQLMFIVCSSASSWIEKNLLSSTGFVGRISFTLTLDELPLVDCAKFWPKNISNFEKLKVLAITGGIPKYLEEVNTKLSAEENIKQLCFTRGGMLTNEFDKIFSDLFMRNSQFYEKIIHILATGMKEQHSIIEILSNEKGNQQYGRITEYLWELEEVGFISRDYTWNIRSGSDSKLSKYRLKDNYLRFYLKYIKKNLDKIKRGNFEFQSLQSLPQWTSIVGLQFENLVLNNRKLLYDSLQINPNEIVNANPFFQNKTSRMKGCQIDYMIQTKTSCLYVCEIKFSKTIIGSDVIEEVQKKIDSMKYPKGFSFRPVLIHVNGVSDDLIDQDYFTNIVDFNELLSGGY